MLPAVYPAYDRQLVTPETESYKKLSLYYQQYTMAPGYGRRLFTPETECYRNSSLRHQQ